MAAASVATVPPLTTSERPLAFHPNAMRFVELSFQTAALPKVAAKSAEPFHSTILFVTSLRKYEFVPRVTNEQLLFGSSIAPVSTKREATDAATNVEASPMIVTASAALAALALVVGM